MSVITLPLAGPSHTLASRNPDAERTINLFPETTASAGAKTERSLRATPGLTAFATATGSPIRGEFSQDGHGWAVCGSSFGEVDSAGTFTVRGTVVDDGKPVSMASNGTAGLQLLLISGQAGYILNLSTNAFAQIADPDFPDDALMCDFMDGYFLVLRENTRQFVISGLEDGTSWDPLDVGERSEGSDNIAALKRNHREIWLVGTETTEVWYDNGDPLFPFAPIQGVFVETGTVAPWSVVRFDNTLGWLNLDERGQGVCWRMDGYTPQRFSTYAQEAGLNGWGRSTHLHQTICFAQQHDGHLFVWFYVNDLDTTWVYDVAEQTWHERAMWDTTQVAWVPHLARCHMFLFGKHLVGARDSAIIYDLSFAVYTP